MSSSAFPIEVVFLGTGTSSSVPHIDCITAHAIPGSSERPPCRTCLSTIDGSVEGKKNIRRNTSIALRIPGDKGSATILIDCGKNFQAAALEWFPRFRLRRIDAVLITHAHADGKLNVSRAHICLILSDIEAWTLSKRIQPHIDIYASQATYEDIKKMFPYLVSKEFASGGGDIPEFVWHIVKEAVPFEITDTRIFVTPFSVQHGRLFTRPPPTAPPVLSANLETSMAQATLEDTASTLPNGDAVPEDIIQPYMCFAFRIQEDIVYLSDVGHIPDDAWSALFPPSGRQLPVCILDCLNLRSHPSHFGLEKSVVAARKIAAKRTYLLGFSHEVAHDEYVTIGEAIGGVEGLANLTENEIKG
ncbi:beta-lactamase-like protein [Mycena sp. CBHHK59/15]|nr:beta-lactamase-like protein [Mycena sp. CBHHK59/15]